ncbi:hypothetical protein [Legionella saoudiensis]|uniref:hypothetical protein n=1 Tax=Legionella saoudiensis TaxID=1750561 RepID=UPI0007307380|nr:hypothetical protein [Legionella saoudiensis]
MANYIVKIPHNGKDYYLIWDTNVDAPAIYGCSLRALKNYYLQEYGEKGLHDLQERLNRVEKKGVSSHIHSNFDELIVCNRAGENEEELTKQEIIEKFCREELYV